MEETENQREKAETNFDLYKYDDTVTKHNRNIQKYFYKFVLKIYCLTYIFIKMFFKLLSLVVKYYL